MNNRNTIQRKLVLEAVQQAQSHATADEIYEAISKDHPSISKATVYRNLNTLATLGEIRKISTDDGADRFDHLLHDHYHIICTSCHKYFDADMDYVADIDKLLKDTHGFKITSHNIIFRGLCPECQKKNSQS